MPIVRRRKQKHLKNGTPLVQFNLLMSLDLDARIRAHADALGVSMISLIRKALEEAYPTMPKDLPEEVVIDEKLDEIVSEKSALEMLDEEVDKAVRASLEDEKPQQQG